MLIPGLEFDNYDRVPMDFNTGSARHGELLSWKTRRNIQAV
jgi:hypothetical protein